MTMLHRLWADEAGFIVSTELVLVATTLAIGMIVGLATVRDQVVQELGDLALAIGNVNQSYVYEGVHGQTSATAGSDFQDEGDFAEPEGGDDVAGQEPLAISVQLPASDEGSSPTPSR